MSAPFRPHAWQLAAADAYHSRLGGVFIGLDPGAGKTYAFARIAARCARPLVLVPSQGVMRQTMAQFRSYGLHCSTVKDWGWPENFPLALGPPAPRQAPITVTFATYAWLQRAAQADFLERFAPSDVLMDEFHEARGLGNSARKRVERHLIDHPRVRVAISTASPMSRSVRDLVFGLRWALRSAVSWLPSTDAGLERLEAELARSGDRRYMFRRELENTPGVFLDVGDVGRYEGRVEISVVRRDPVLTLPDTWELPNGFLVESAAHAADLERQLAWGFYPEYDPRPSAAYIEARRTWGAVVRRVIGTGQADTEFQVRALRPKEYAAWAAAEAAEGPLTEPGVTWATRHAPRSLGHSLPDGPTLIWARHRALQDEAGRVLGAPVFREGARSADGAYLPDYRGRRAVASAESCYQSLNLQHFNHNVILEPSADPEWWRQAIGRTARQGQTAHRCTFDVVVNCRAAERALRTALDAAENVRQITGKSNPLLQLLGKV